MNILTSVVGASFRPTEVKNIIRNLAHGDEVILRPEPTNEHDANAVQVFYEDTFIGYIPKSENVEVLHALASFESYVASVVGFANPLKPFVEIEFGA